MEKNMEKEKGLILHFSNIIFLSSLLGAAIYRVQNGLDTKKLFSVFYIHSGLDYALKYKKSKRKYHIIMSLLSIANAILLILLCFKSKEEE